MFQTIKPQQIFNPRRQVLEGHPAYWLAQLRKADWLQLLQIAQLPPKSCAKKQNLAQVALDRFGFAVCPSLGAARRAARVCEHRRATGLQAETITIHPPLHASVQGTFFSRGATMDTIDTITINKTFAWQVADVPVIPTPENWQDFVDLAPNTRCPVCEGAGRVGRQRCRTCGGQGEIGG